MIAYLSTNLWTLWTIIAVLCLIIELGSGDFFVTCFAIGALCALVATLVGLPLWVQVLVFALCSVASIIFIRPSLLKRIHNRAERPSNADALIGRKGLVIEAIIPGGSGYVKIDGDEWKAVSVTGETIAKGETVEVTGRESIIVKVKR